MIKLKEVEKQLKSIDANNKFWGRPEIVELQHILVPGEKIQAAMNGRYAGGLALFCVTDQRLLLVDKKLFFLTVEDLRYDMVNEVDFSGQLVTGTLSVCTPTKTMTFTTFKPAKLRKMATLIQGKVMEIRQDYGLHQPQGQPLKEKTLQPALQEQAPKPFSSMVEVTELPVPRRLNPYMGAPLMMRRRVGRFGPISTHPKDIATTGQQELIWARR